MKDRIETFGKSNVARRRIVLKAGEQFPTHGHNYSHAHAVVIGKVRCEIADGGGTTVSEYEAPAMFAMPPTGVHTLTALTDYEGWCLFAVRDEDGGVEYEPSEAQLRDPKWHESLT